MPLKIYLAGKLLDADQVGNIGDGIDKDPTDVPHMDTSKTYFLQGCYLMLIK